MTTYKIKNIVPQDDNTMIVFYEFSKGDTFSNKFPIETPVDDIRQWGVDKCTWFDEREAQLEEMKQELLEEPLIEE